MNLASEYTKVALFPTSTSFNLTISRKRSCDERHRMFLLRASPGRPCTIERRGESQTRQTVHHISEFIEINAVVVVFVEFGYHVVYV